VSNLAVGLLSVVLATNLAQTANTNADDAVAAEYRKVLVDDDAAEQDVLSWTDNAEAFAKAGGDEARLNLHLRIRQRLEGVRKEYEDFLKRHPDHVNAHLAFGSFLNDTEDEEGAVAQWDAARLLAPTNAAAWDNLANYYGHRGPVKKAFEYYEKAIALDGNQSVYYHNLATTIYLFRPDAEDYYHLSEEQVFDKSLELYRKAIGLAPDDFVLFSDYAMSFYGTNPPRWKDGLEAWTEALKVTHDEEERQGVYLHLARINIKLGNFEAAQERLKAVTAPQYEGLKRTLTRNLTTAEGQAAGKTK
jgi:tetratricopeptide (TPR) repeat protein